MFTLVGNRIVLEQKSLTSLIRVQNQLKMRFYFFKLKEYDREIYNEASRLLEEESEGLFFSDDYIFAVQDVAMATKLKLYGYPITRPIRIKAEGKDCPRISTSFDNVVWDVIKKADDFEPGSIISLKYEGKNRENERRICCRHDAENELKESVLKFRNKNKSSAWSLWGWSNVIERYKEEKSKSRTEKKIMHQFGRKGKKLRPAQRLEKNKSRVALVRSKKHGSNRRKHV